MTVWILEEDFGPYEPAERVGVFSSKEAAMGYAYKMGFGRGSTADIWVIEELVDNPTERGEAVRFFPDAYEPPTTPEGG